VFAETTSCYLPLRGNRKDDAGEYTWNFTLTPVKPPEFAEFCDATQEFWFDPGRAERKLGTIVFRRIGSILSNPAVKRAWEAFSSAEMNVRPKIVEWQNQSSESQRLCTHLAQYWTNSAEKLATELTNFKTQKPRWEAQRKSLGGPLVAPLKDLAAAARKADAKVASDLDEMVRKLEQNGLDTFSAADR
jgi:hypothetical protein